MITELQIMKLNPTMAVMAITGQGASLTKAGYRVMEIACRNGGYVAAGTGAHNGHVERVSASAIMSLVRRGYLTAMTSPDGNYAARLSPRSRERLEYAITKTTEAS